MELDTQLREIKVWRCYVNYNAIAETKQYQAIQGKVLLYFYMKGEMEMEKNKRKLTKYEKKMVLGAIGTFILGIAMVPVLQGLACFICILAEI